MAAAMTISGPGFNPFGRAWAAYERTLRRRPVLTQAVSSTLLWGLGDAMAQRIETRGDRGVDARRVALTSAFGGAIIGPAGHGWYLLLERLVLRLGLACNTKAMLLKVAIDNLLYSPCYVLAFFAYGCIAIDGLSPAAFAEKMKEEFVPTMLAEAMVWPPYMAAVFSRVPVQHQLLAVNVATLFDVCFLSWVRNRDADGDHACKQQQQNMMTQGRAKSKQDADPGRPRVKGRRLQGKHLPPPPAPPGLTAGEATRRELAACLWDTFPERSLGSMALMAASATCSTGGGGVVMVRTQW